MEIINVFTLLIFILCAGGEVLPLDGTIVKVSTNTNATITFNLPTNTPINITITYVGNNDSQSGVNMEIYDLEVYGTISEGQSISRIIQNGCGRNFNNYNNFTLKLNEGNSVSFSFEIKASILNFPLKLDQPIAIPPLSKLCWNVNVEKCKNYTFALSSTDTISGDELGVVQNDLNYINYWRRSPYGNDHPQTYVGKYICATEGVAVVSVSRTEKESTLVVLSGAQNCAQYKDCSGENGVCLNGKCHCNTPFTGDSCDQIDNTQVYQLKLGESRFNVSKTYAYGIIELDDNTVSHQNLVVSAFTTVPNYNSSIRTQYLLPDFNYMTNSPESFIQNRYQSELCSASVSGKKVLVQFQLFAFKLSIGEQAELVINVQLVDRTISVPSTLNMDTYDDLYFETKVKYFRISGKESVNQKVTTTVVGDQVTSVNMFTSNNCSQELHYKVSLKTFSIRTSIDDPSIDYYVAVVYGGNFTIQVATDSSLNCGGCGRGACLLNGSCSCLIGSSGSRCDNFSVPFSPYDEKVSARSYENPIYYFNNTNNAPFILFGGGTGSGRDSTLLYFRDDATYPGYPQLAMPLNRFWDDYPLCWDLSKSSDSPYIGTWYIYLVDNNADWVVRSYSTALSYDSVNTVSFAPLRSLQSNRYFYHVYRVDLKDGEAIQLQNVGVDVEVMLNSQTCDYFGVRDNIDHGYYSGLYGSSPLKLPSTSDFDCKGRSWWLTVVSRTADQDIQLKASIVQSIYCKNNNSPTTNSDTNVNASNKIGLNVVMTLLSILILVS